MRRYIIMMFMLCAFGTASVYAHSGRTNSDGCHNNSKTGGYHCHGGGAKSNESSEGLFKSLLEPDKSTESKPASPVPTAKSTTPVAVNQDATCTRSEWKFSAKKSPYSEDKYGWYTGLTVDKTDVEHIVSLHDACAAGGYLWDTDMKRKFSNDAENHVGSVEYVNRTIKNKYTPKEFIQRMEANEQYDFAPNKKCAYLWKYITIKVKHRLSFVNNDTGFIMSELVDCRSRR